MFDVPSPESRQRRIGCFRLLFLLAALVPAQIALPAVSVAEDTVSSLRRDIEKAVRAGEEGDVLPLAKKIAAIGGEDAAKTLFEIGLRVTAPKLFKGIAKILARMIDDAEAYEVLLRESKGSNEARLIYIADIVGQMQDPRAAELVANMVDSRSERVILSVIPALVELRSRHSIPPLLDLLDKFESKRRSEALIYHEIRDALYEITGFDFETLEDWRKWWDPVKDTYDPERVQSGKTRVERVRKDNAAEFAGRKIFAKNVVFVIDTSGTMRFVMKDDIPGLMAAAGTDAVSGAKKVDDEELTPENERLARFWTRIEMAKRELKKALSAFSQGVRFGVIEFNKSVKQLQKRPTRASNSAKKKALTWVDNMKFSTIPGTNTKEALEAAFKMDRNVSEIYFLSDGLPSADGQKNDDPMPILDDVESWNRFRKIKIHTFGYDPKPLRPQLQGQENEELKRANRFLELLAERTGGKFTLLKVTDEQPPDDFK